MSGDLRVLGHSGQMGTVQRLSKREYPDTDSITKPKKANMTNKTFPSNQWSRKQMNESSQEPREVNAYD